MQGEDKTGKQGAQSEEADREPVMHPAEPVPVRLDSEPLSEAASEGSQQGSKGQPEAAEGKADAPKARPYGSNPVRFTF